MRRSVLRSLLAGAAIFAAACSSGDQGQDPSGPSLEPSPGAESDITLRCRQNGLIVVQLAGILSPRPPQRLLQTAIQKFALVEFALLTRKKTLAQTRALDLIDFLTRNRSNLINPGSNATAIKLGNVVDAILCLVGLPLTGVPLDSNTGIGVVPANNPTPVIIRVPQGDVGIKVPAFGAPDEDVNGNPILAIVVTVKGNEGPLNTKLDQYGQTIDLSASQVVEWLEGGVTVAICVPEDLAPGLFNRLRIGHEGGLEEDRFGAIEILDPAAAADIGEIVGGGCTFSDLSSRSAFDGLRSFAERVLLPDLLHAAVAVKTGGVGGLASRFSKFGPVDPQLDVIALPTSTDGTAGAPVAQPPSVRIQTEQGTLIDGIAVGFVGGGATVSIAPAQVTTNSSGVAATTSWVLGLGENTVVATPVPPVDAITFTPPSVTFTATGTENPIEYRSAGYRFISIGSTPPSGSTGNYPAGQWFLPGFTPPSAWGTGGAPFGESGAGCSIYGTSPVVTTWEASPEEATQADPSTGTGLLVRRVFTTPVGYEGGIVISVAIDNDIQVYVDGNDITDTEAVPFARNTNTDAVNGFWDDFISPFQPHGGCAQQDDGTFTVPNSFLSTGTTHVVAVYAHDWGGASYLDIQVALPGE